MKVEGTLVSGSTGSTGSTLKVSISLINDINILMCVHFINLGTYDSSFTSKL